MRHDTTHAKHSPASLSASGKAGRGNVAEEIQKQPQNTTTTVSILQAVPKLLHRGIFQCIFKFLFYFNYLQKASLIKCFKCKFLLILNHTNNLCANMSHV